MMLPIVVLLDTSVFVEIIDVPGMNARRSAILDELEERLDRGDELMLPLATVIETGNHIAKAAKRRFRVAQGFVKHVDAAMKGESPFTMTQPLSPEWIVQWLREFPDHANSGRGMADLSIIKEWERQRILNRDTRRVQIWTLDKDLSGYDA